MHPMMRIDEAPLPERPKPLTVRGSERRREILEVVVVLLVAVLPYLLSAWFAQPGGAPFAGPTRSIDRITGAIETSVPILYIIYRTGEGWARFGIRAFRPTDALVAAGLWAATWLGCRAFTSPSPFSFPVTSQGSIPVPSAPAFSLFGSALLVVSLAAGAFAEEVAMRSFLLHRLEKLTQSKAWAVVIASLLFGSYHIYEGLWNAMSVTFMGLVFSIYFVNYRRIAPLVLAHTAWNVWLTILSMRH